MTFCRVRGCECAGMCFREHEKRIAALESQLTEECAKRQATEGLARNLRIQLNAAEEGQTLALQAADKAERELAEARANSRGVERLRASHYELEGIVCRRDKELEEAVERAEKAEALREQAETALLNGKTRVDCCCYEGAHKRWAERAKKAEARAKELEAEKLHAIADYSRRLAELQAFVDACRVRNCERRGRMPDDGTCGRCPPCLASDLAAKEDVSKAMGFTAKDVRRAVESGMSLGERVPGLHAKVEAARLNGISLNGISPSFVITDDPLKPED